MNHDHLGALSALLFAAPLAVLVLAAVEVAATRGIGVARRAAARAASGSGTARLCALLVLVSAAIHAGLVPGHLDEPQLAVSFVAAAIALSVLALAAYLELPLWQPMTASVLVAVLVAYAGTRIAGGEAVDVLGLAAAGIELFTLLLIARSARPREREDELRAAADV